MARRYEFYVRVARTISHEWRVRYCSCHSNIKYISSCHRVLSSIYVGTKRLAFHLSPQDGNNCQQMSDFNSCQSNHTHSDERLVKLCKIYCDIWHQVTRSVCTGGRVGVHYDFVTKFSRMDSLPNFVTHGAPLRTKIQVSNSFILCATSDYENIFPLILHKSKGGTLILPPHALKTRDKGWVEISFRGQFLVSFVLQ